MNVLPLVVVAAVAENGVIGRGNALPWRLKADLRRFRDLTWGKPLIMGRRCWDSIGRPLPGRETVVLTRLAGFDAPGAHVVTAWPAAQALAAEIAATSGATEIVIAGGAEIYRLALPRAARLHLTRVHASPEGDVLFPPFDGTLFEETRRESHPADTENEHAFTFVDLERLPATPQPVEA